MNHSKYRKEMLAIGLPVTLQSIFQASYSFVDQLMVGKLGKASIAASGLGSKFSVLVTFTLSSVAAVASILISQYRGSKDEKGVSQSFFSCLYLSVLVMAVFMIPTCLFPSQIIRFYTNEENVIPIAANYLRIIGISYAPMMVTMLLAAFLRSIEKSRYPMYASVTAVFSNLFFNYIFIFGKLGAPKLGLGGAGIGTLIARSIEAVLLVIWIVCLQKKKVFHLHARTGLDAAFYKKISVIVVPILVNEFSWSVGENIYASVYGHLGEDALAAMTLTNPLQGMFIGMFSGISSAAVVMVGKRLGNNERHEADAISRYLLRAGLIGAVCISALLALLIPFYVRLFDIDASVRKITISIVYALAIIMSAKILNMILGGGILRSGGNTNLTLKIDLIGTWIFGVPLALLSAFVFKLPIYLVYFILSLEEVVRLCIGLYVFKKGTWARNITASKKCIVS